MLKLGDIDPEKLYRATLKQYYMYVINLPGGGIHDILT